jgi:hypothetical protein
MMDEIIMDMNTDSEQLDTLRQRIEKTIAESMPEDKLKGILKNMVGIFADILGDLEWRMQTDAAYNLAYFVQREAEHAIEAMLAGNVEQFEKHLTLTGYTGRDRQHSVIRGKLFETGAIELRRKIVDAFPERLKSERILDLEDQIKSLIAEIQRLETSNAELKRRG